ncbi:MAG: TetR/AcrR family transcriptional regulator [Ardenticatenaceae bacterium]|nr:TetR/AcrR family transcriptional regulator [Ardenticatenaceae bacterium]
MSQNRDPRTRRTQLSIRDAFIELLIEQGFDNITVRAVTERANINRATFYRHYTDIHDLAARLTDLLFVDVVSNLREEPAISNVESWAILFEHVAQYAPFYRAMIGPQGIPGFRDRVQESVEVEMRQWLETSGVDEAQAKMPTALAVRYMAAAQVGFIQWWLENEMPFAPMEAAVYLMNLHFQGGGWALGFSP